MQCLNLLNFGDNLISWVRLLRSKSISRVEQNGHFTSIFELSRGCRQGDPISPYIFVLCAEFLAHVIRENSDIKGITLHNREVKISLYADDTTIYIRTERDSMSGVMRVLDWFKKISGLGVNIEKTKVVKIGRSRDRSIAWEGKYNLKWTDEFEVLGISYNILKMGEISDYNILNKLKDIKKIIAIWKTRRLTPYGKVVIIKSLLFSKFTHILLSLPTPGKETFRTINNLVKDFLWEGKPPKFRKEILEADTQFGRMKLHNLELFDAALKVGWLKRYVRSNAKWCVIPDEFELFNLFKYGIDFLERIQEMTENSFWKDVLNSLRVLGKKDGFISSENILLTPLWHNPQLRLQIKKNWLDSGVQIISDLLDDDMKPYALKRFEDKFGIKTNFLEYGAFCKVIKNHLDQRELPMHIPLMPTNCTVFLYKKGVSNIYKIMLGKNKNILVETSDKWNEKMELSISSLSMGRSFKKILIIDDTYLRYIQFRTLHRRFYTNNVLHKIGINEHMLIQCEVSNEIWTQVQSWIQNIGIERYTITDEKKILGDFGCSYWVNAIILNTKKCIFVSKVKEIKPTLSYIKSTIKNMHSYEIFSFKR